MARDDKTAEQHEWWNVWRSNDYSWEGLAKHSIRGGSGVYGEKTLQDYWRRNPATGEVRSNDALKAAGELVEGPEGRLWHVVHLPPRWSEHTVTWKAQLQHANWGRVEALVRERIGHGVELALRWDGAVTGQDGRAQLQGAVLRNLPAHPNGIEKPVHLQAQHAAFFGEVDCTGWNFGVAARFDGAYFAGIANFERASFAQRAWFNDVKFSGLAQFTSARFAEGTRFQGANFLGAANFGSATWLGVAAFNRSKFGEDARFEEARFVGEAWFEQMSFEGYTTFSGAKFNRYAGFLNARFLNSTRFRETSFGEIAAFEEAELHQDATFDGAKFTAVDRSLLRAQLVFWPVILFGIALVAWGLVLDGLWRSAVNVGAVVSFVVACGWSILGGRIVGEDKQQERLMRAFRTLTLLCENARNRRDAAKFYRLELKSARLRWKTNPAERFFSWLYDVSADYGESIVRPIISLGLVILVFSAAFSTLEGKREAHQGATSTNRFLDSDFIDAGRYSLSRAFPFGPWTESDGEGNLTEEEAEVSDCSFRNRLLAAGDCRPSAWGQLPSESAAAVAAHRLVIGAVSTVESVFAILLGFLFALAVRRRFQIA